jgi:hypothetical protein
MIIDYTLDASITQSPYASSIENAISDAVLFYQSEFTNNVGITIDFGFGEEDNKQIDATAAAQNTAQGSFLSYATLEAALSSHAVSYAGYFTPLSSILPSAAAVPAGAEFWVTYAEQKALGLMSANSGEVDGYVGLSDTLNWSWNQMVSGFDQNDAVGAIEHEISEVMGRLGFLDNANAFVPPTSNDYGPMDLYRFSSTGNRDFAQGDGFFSLNDGATLLTEFNNPLNGGDAADWIPSLEGDSFGDNYSGVASVITGTDLAAMQALGWTQSSLPDLTANNVATNFVTTVQQANYLTVSYNLDNIGIAPIAATTGYVYLYTNPPSLNDTGTLIAVISQPEVLADSINPMSVEAYIPGNLAPGTYYVGVKINPNFNVTESNYINDYSSNVVEITVTAEPGPTVVSVSSSHIGNPKDAQFGSTVLFTVSTNEPVFVSGTPELQLSNGAVAVYATGSGTNTLQFVYDPVVGQYSNDLKVASSILYLNGANILDGAGASLAGSVAYDTGVAIDSMPVIDFNGDGLSDVLLRNTNGDLLLWDSNSAGNFTAHDFPVGNSWQVAGTGDFNGDGRSDILLRNTNGDLLLWDSNSAGNFTAHDFPVGNSWQVAGTGDFNGDGRSDILLRNTNGDLLLWDSNSAGNLIAHDFGVVDNSWQVAGTGDFNGDGSSDILWRNTGGDLTLWDSNGSGGFTGHDYGIVDNSWQVAGTGDFNGNGLSDILWRNTNGDLTLWNSNGSGGFTAHDYGIVGNSWQVAGTGDFNGDGHADILWRNTNGDLTQWNSNGSGGFTAHDLGPVDNSWSVQKIT